MIKTAIKQGQLLSFSNNEYPTDISYMFHLIHIIYVYADCTMATLTPDYKVNKYWANKPGCIGTSLVSKSSCVIPIGRQESGTCGAKKNFHHHHFYYNYQILFSTYLQHSRCLLLPKHQWNTRWAFVRHSTEYFHTQRNNVTFFLKISLFL